MLTCKQASQLISKSLDQPLSWSERLQLRLHLFFCDACTNFKQQLKTILVALRLMRNAVEDDSSITLSLDAKERIARSIDSNRQ